MAGSTLFASFQDLDEQNRNLIAGSSASRLTLASEGTKIRPRCPPANFVAESACGFGEDSYAQRALAESVERAETDVEKKRMKLPLWCDLMALRTCVIVLVSCCGCSPQQPALPPPPPIEVTVSQPLQQAVTDSLEFTGTTAPVGSVEVRSRVTGFLETVHFKAPAEVKQGDVLFTIDPRPFKNRVDSTTTTLAGCQTPMT